MKAILLLCILAALLVSCAAPNKFCTWTDGQQKKCLQLTNDFNESKCKELLGTPAKDCGR